MSGFSPRAMLLNLRPMVWNVAKIVCAGHVFCETVAAIQPCGGMSMLPTLDAAGDAVLLVPLAYWRPKFLGFENKRPERGDLVVATNMTDPAYTVCKRVIGIEGDVVEIQPTRSMVGPKTWGEGRFVRVPKGHVWIVGDNLSNSTDSRDYGPVPIAMIKGKAVGRVSRVQGPFVIMELVSDEATLVIALVLWSRRNLRTIPAYNPGSTVLMEVDLPS